MGEIKFGTDGWRAVVGKDFKPFKKSKPKSAMFPSVDTKLSNSLKNILNILYVYVAL